jgi:hypothetical protein
VAKTRVVFILGSGRSGSTLFANLLGGVEGMTSVGELRYLWSRGVIQNRRCGCGEPFDACPFWRAVLTQAYQGQPMDAEQASEELAQAVRLRQLPGYAGAGTSRAMKGAAAGIAEQLARIYRAISETTGGATVVDSSKLPTFAWLIDAIPSLEVTFIHLIRDPRAVAYSWARVKPLPDAAAGATMQRIGALKSSSLWDIWNATAYGMGRRRRYLRVRYEDFVGAPQSILQQVLGMVGKENAVLPFTDDGLALLRITHTVAGNPSRMTRGPISIKSDSEWEQQLRPWKRLVVTGATAPLLRTFGYPFFPARQGA